MHALSFCLTRGIRMANYTFKEVQVLKTGIVVGHLSSRWRNFHLLSVRDVETLCFVFFLRRLLFFIDDDRYLYLIVDI